MFTGLGKQHEISRPISIKCGILLVVHAQNELLHLVKSEICSDSLVLLNVFFTFADI
jgi:hypothetical protein